MIVEEVYNIDIYLPEKEFERIYTLLEKHDCNQGKLDCNHPKKKFINDDQGRITLLYHNLVRFTLLYSALPQHSPPYPVVHTNHFRNFAL